MTKQQQNKQNTVYNYKSPRSNTDFRGKIKNKWKHYNNRSLSHLKYSYPYPIPISLSNLVSIPMGIPWEG